MWTMRHGRLIGPDAASSRSTSTPTRSGAHRDRRLGVVGDVRATAEAVVAALAGPDGDRLADAGAGGGDPASASAGATCRTTTAATASRIDPRTLTIALDDLLPAERVVAVDSGNFMGYPSMFLAVPDEFGFCFTQAFQSIGLGLATAIGAALARPDRLPVAALGDGGALMGASELETVVRLGLPMVVVVYNDEAYGAEVHHFGPDGHPLDTVGSRRPTSPRSPAARLRGGHRAHASTTWRRWRTGWTGRASGRCWSTPR